LHRPRRPPAQVLEDASDDCRNLDQRDDAHRPAFYTSALGAFQGLGLQSRFMQMGDNPFASLSSPRPQRGRGAGGDPASSHVLDDARGTSRASAAPT
jgi:hypothetical protein